MTKDMTAGKPLGLILRFCGPMVFGNILQQLYSMVDTVIVGRYLGASALAGVGATGAISFLVVGFATGICTGLSIPVAQAFGAGDYQNMRKNIANSYYLGALIGVLLTIFTMIGTGTILHWMKTPDDIYQYSYDYIIVIFGGILTSVLYNSLAAILRAVGDSKSPILFLAISSVLNIVLDLVFLVGLHSGVAGAGYATVISQGISGLLCLFYLYKKFEIMRFQQGECRLELKRCSRLLSIGLPMALQFSITAIGSIILQTSVDCEEYGKLLDEVGSQFYHRHIVTFVVRRTEDLCHCHGPAGIAWHHNGNLLRTESGCQKVLPDPRRHSPEHVRFHVLLCILYCFPVDSGKIHRIPVPRSL